MLGYLIVYLCVVICWFHVLTWTVVNEMHCEDSSHGKMCGEWVIPSRCEVLIAYCANCELIYYL